MRIFCNSCGSETNHNTEAEYVTLYEDIRAGLPTGFWEKRRQRFLICAGCEAASLEISWTTSESHNPNTGKRHWSKEYFPRRTRHDAPRKRFKQLPGRLDAIYRETVRSYNMESRILTAVGLRSLVEGICKDQGIGKNGESLYNRIDELKAILPDHIVDDLHEFRFMGNEAVHELESPPESELRIAIDICEDLLNYIYELDYKVKQLSSSRNKDESAEIKNQEGD